MIHRGSLNKRLAEFIVATLLGVTLFLLPAPGEATSSVEVADVTVDAEESEESVKSADKIVLGSQATETDTSVGEEKADSEIVEVSPSDSDATGEATNPESSKDETLIIVDEDESQTAATEFIIIDDGDSSETSFEPYFEPTGRFRGDYRTRALWDVVHEGDAEDVFEWWQQLNLYLKYQFAEQWDTVVETDTRYGVVGEAPQENPFWGVNVSYSKWLSEVSLRQGYLRWRDAGWEVSFGSRILFGEKTNSLPPAIF